MRDETTGGHRPFAATRSRSIAEVRDFPPLSGQVWSDVESTANFWRHALRPCAGLEAWSAITTITAAYPASVADNRSTFSIGQARVSDGNRQCEVILIPPERKIVTEQTLIAEGGIAIIARCVNDMGYLFHDRRLDHGIDGAIELVDPDGHALNQIVMVQSKASNRMFRNETADSFQWTARAADLNYWLDANTPVIVVLSHPNKDEAWWFDVRRVFSDPERRQKRTVVIDKRRQAFDKLAAVDIMRLATLGTASARASGQVAQPSVAAVGTVAAADALELGVHSAPAVEELGQGIATGGTTPEGVPVLPRYLNRPHDIRLRKLLAQSADQGRSMLVTLTGESAVGKTRALWEAVRAELPDWKLLAPADAAELSEWLQTEQVSPCTLLWLDEIQRYLHGAVGEVTAHLLARTLADTQGVVAVGAMWFRPYWTDFTAQGTSPDISAAARTLLTGPHAQRIGVPDSLDEAQQQGFANLVGEDRRMAAALAAGTADGRVIQHLTGGPELLSGYLDGGLFTPVERALITAAIDARRLGHLHPMPGPLLVAAADGYLAPWQHPADEGMFADALVDLARGYRADGSRTDIRNTLTALTAVRTHAGADPGYEPHDYLQQNVGQQRTHHIPPTALWAAAAGYADPDDLAALGSAAHAYGLYRASAQLHKYAVAHGNPLAACDLIRHLHQLHPDDPGPARWAVDHIALDDPDDLDFLLHELRQAGLDEQIARLLARGPAIHVKLDRPSGVAALLRSLHRVDACEQVALLAERACLININHHPGDLAYLLGALDEVGAKKQIARLLARNPAAHVPLNDPDGVAYLLRRLRRLKADEQVTRLLARNPATHVAFSDHPDGIVNLLSRLWEAGARRQVALLAERAATHIPLTNPTDVIYLLRILRHVGMHRQVSLLASRAALELPADQLTVDDPVRLARLLSGPHGSGRDEQVIQRLARDAAIHAVLDKPFDIIGLLESLDHIGLREQVIVLADRAAAHAALGDPAAVALLLKKMHKIGLREQVIVLADRAAAHAALRHPGDIALLMNIMREIGVHEETLRLAERTQGAALADWEACEALEDSEDLNFLLDEMRHADAEAQAAALVARLPGAGLFERFLDQGENKIHYRYGREPDGTPAASWTWEQLD